MEEELRVKTRSIGSRVSLASNPSGLKPKQDRYDDRQEVLKDQSCIRNSKNKKTKQIRSNQTRSDTRLNSRTSSQIESPKSIQAQNRDFHQQVKQCVCIAPEASRRGEV
jgi:hypothetical protein